MKKTLTILACTLVFAVPAFARYIVVLKNGTRYTAKAKWTVTNGKAIVQLENGQSLQLDPALIDVAKSEQVTKIGVQGATVLDLEAEAPKPKAPQQPSLGSQIKLRRPAEQRPQDAAPAKPAPASTASPVAPSAGSLPTQVLDKFERAFEEVGIFEKNVKSTGANSLRADLTVDTEERVFNALSATSFLMVKNAGQEGVRIDMVELFMKTTTGGAAGRFQMTRADAQALDAAGPNGRPAALRDYFVRKVIY
jgi:hypothetical protein